MKKVLFILLGVWLLVIVILFASYNLPRKCTQIVMVKEKEESSTISEIGLLNETVEKALATAPNTISEEQFYKYESAIEQGYSGSSGYNLSTKAINWILEAENAFSKKGIKLKDWEHRHSVIAWSYFSCFNELYNKALEEFKNIKDQAGIELTEWVIDNKGIKNGTVKIKEYQGKIPDSGSETAKTENGRYLFVACFKGPVYRYDKQKKLHAVVYYPDDQYDWCDELKIEGEKLIISLRDGAGKFVFNNATNKLSQSDKKVASAIVN